MDDRLALQALLEQAFPELKVYYRPTEFTLEYPCIVYDMTNHIATHANDKPYILGTSFQVTLLSTVFEDVDTKRMFKIPAVRHVRSYTEKNIVHDVYTVSIKAS